MIQDDKIKEEMINDKHLPVLQSMILVQKI